MGGNALKTFQENKTIKLRRMTGERYLELVKEIEQKLSLYLYGKIVTIPAYRGKDDFGDLDILIEIASLRPVEQATVHAAIREAFNPVCVIQQKNSRVISFSYSSFQIDAILSPPEEFDFALSYYSWNDLGNLMGRVADAMGFKFGFDGLWKIKYEKERTVLVSKTLVTRDIAEAFDFLGFDYSRFLRGFHSLTDLFYFVASSKYFSGRIYSLATRNAKARVRDEKRKTYMAFLNWIEEESEACNPLLREYEFPSDAHEVFYHEACLRWQDLKFNVDTAETKFLTASLVKAKFNGKIIKELLNIDGKQLGIFLGYLENIGAFNDAFDQWVIHDSTTPAMIQNWIQKEWSIFIS